jgi:hypothetical protein
MRKGLFMVLVALIMQGQAGAWERSAWELGSTAHWQLAANAMVVADYLQTRRVIDDPERFSELNPILGSHPTESRLNVYYLLSLGALNAARWVLPAKPLRLLYQSVTAVEVMAVGRNYMLGVEFGF